MPRDVAGYLAGRKAGEDAELAQFWAEIENLHTRRLWHQLTVALMQLVRHESFQEDGLLELYQSFLADFEHKINPLSLVEIILVVAKQIRDPDEAVTFLESIKEKVKHNLEARVLCTTAIGLVKLNGGQLDAVKKLIEEAGEQLDSVGGVTAVHARYYDLCSTYYKLKANHGAFYRDALRFLGCVDIKDIPVEEQRQRALSLSLAALLGEDVYNFGELLAHPVLESLRGGEYEWVMKLLAAFNAGDLGEYYRLKMHWEKQPDLCSNEDKLLRKIQLLSLMELVFKRHAHDRTIPFTVVAEAAQVALDQVELLVMKALALGLVKGTIDEVNKEVSMTWVQPRVLDLQQTNTLRLRMDDWCSHIKKTLNLVKDEIPDIAVSS